MKIRLAPLLLALAIQPVLADMADPTRPPPGLGARPAGDALATPALEVSSVFLMGRHPYALVDGMTVRPGDRLGESRVSRIDEQGVWLRTPAGPRLLRLVPDVQKQPAARGKTRMENAK